MAFITINGRSVLNEMYEINYTENGQINFILKVIY